MGNFIEMLLCILSCFEAKKGEAMSAQEFLLALHEMNSNVEFKKKGV